MDKGSIWWGQVINAKQIIDNITDNICAGENVVLTLPAYIPWQDFFYNSIDSRLRQEFADKTIEIHDQGQVQGEVGKYMLKEFCRPEVQSRYRGFQSYAAFMAQTLETDLHDRIIWVKQVQGEQLQEWLDFVSDYTEAVHKCDEYRSPARFILEGPAVTELQQEWKNIVRVSFDEQITDYDRYSFCTMLATEVDCKDFLQQYLSDVVSLVCGVDIELCAACVAHWESFLQNPEMALRSICQEERRSDGSAFELEQILPYLNKKLWEAQVRNVFPAIEKYRIAFLEGHREYLEVLPEQEEDLEIGRLAYYAGTGQLYLKNEEATELNNYKAARNTLAHLGTLGYKKVKEFLKNAAKYN